MWLKSLNILATALLATVSYGEVLLTQAPPEPPAAPQEPAGRTKVKHLKVYAPNAGGAYLGVGPRDVTQDRVAALKLDENRGVEVMMVDRDSPGGKAGLREHDVILGFNGKPVANVEELRAMLRSTTPGTTVPLTISRGGQETTLNVELGKRPEMFAAMPPMPPMPPLDIDVPNVIVLQSSSRNGVMVEDLTSQLADFFGVKNGGVLVRSVDRGSAGDTAGLKAGDVIVKVANQSISCSSDWRRLMRAQHGSVQLGVIRDKREQGVTIKLPEKNPEESWNFDSPELQKQIQDLRAEIERRRPEFEKQVLSAQADAQKAMKEHPWALRVDSPEFQKELETLRAELELQRPELQKQMAMAQAEFEKAVGQHQHELDEMLKQMRSEDFQHEMEKARKALEDALKDLQKE